MYVLPSITTFQWLQYQMKIEIEIFSKFPLHRRTTVRRNAGRNLNGLGFSFFSMRKTIFFLLTTMKKVLKMKYQVKKKVALEVLNSPVNFYY